MVPNFIITNNFLSNEDMSLTDAHPKHTLPCLAKFRVGQHIWFWRALSEAIDRGLTHICCFLPKTLSTQGVRLRSIA